jgi:Ca2+-binding EF-hand superfamily protein
VLWLLLAPALLAQEGEDNRDAQLVDFYFKHNDTNADGKITLDEVRARMRARLKDLRAAGNDAAKLAQAEEKHPAVLNYFYLLWADEDDKLEIGKPQLLKAFGTLRQNRYPKLSEKDYLLAAEIHDEEAGTFAARDKNSDGFIAGDEFAKEEDWREFDSNADGKLSKAEYLAIMVAELKRATGEK